MFPVGIEPTIPTFHQNLRWSVKVASQGGPAVMSLEVSARAGSRAQSSTAGHFLATYTVAILFSRKATSPFCAGARQGEPGREPTSTSEMWFLHPRK